MSQSVMTVRLDDQIKSQFDKLCEKFGMSANAAINVFVNTVVRTRSIPFPIRADENYTIRERALEAFCVADRSDRPELTLEQINNEIRAARREYKKRPSKTKK